MSSKKQNSPSSYLSKRLVEGWAQLTHSTPRLYAWRSSLMALLRQLIKRLLCYDDQSLMRFDQAWQDWYRQTMGGASVLDVGCGAGSHLGQVLKYGRAKHYIGIDISTGLIRSATRLFPQHEFCVGDSCHLPLRDQSVDVAISSFTFHHILPDRTCCSAKRVDACRANKSHP